MTCPRLSRSGHRRNRKDVLGCSSMFKERYRRRSEAGTAEAKFAHGAHRQAREGLVDSTARAVVFLHLSQSESTPRRPGTSTSSFPLSDVFRRAILPKCDIHSICYHFVTRIVPFTLPKKESRGGGNMPGVPSSRGCDACRKQKKKVCVYLREVGRCPISQRSDGYASVTRGNRRVRDVPACESSALAQDRGDSSLRRLDPRTGPYLTGRT